MQDNILTVTQLNRQVKLYLETEIPYVHVEGEVSNLKKAASGHLYFSLKDAGAQIRCVHFKNRHDNISYALKEGQQIIAHGKLSLYEARGDYQLIVERLSDAGLGRLYQQFEALKKKLAAEGLFDASRKKALPAFPETIGIITSTAGAAIQDIFATLGRRYPYARLLVYPSEVQGAQAGQQLLLALNRAMSDQAADVLIIGRGGGSIEDLWCFNDEKLARAIADCPIPIVAGIGHETDFSIADFAADLRAATPTAAAEAVSPDSAKLIEGFGLQLQRLKTLMMQQLKMHQSHLSYLRQKIASPSRVIFSYWQRIDYLERSLLQAIIKFTDRQRHQLQLLETRLKQQNPALAMQRADAELRLKKKALLDAMQLLIQKRQDKLALFCKTLHAVSPLATLDRGYAIASSHQKIIFKSQDVEIGQTIHLQLAKGHLDCEVLNKGEE